jgi:hypothetical protein
MPSLTHQDVTAMLGDLDDVVVAKIIASGATAEELAEANAWLSNDEAMLNAGRPLPHGRIARLVETLVAIKEEEEAQDEAVRQG